MFNWIREVKKGLEAIVDASAKGPLEYKNKRVELGRLLLYMREYTELAQYDDILEECGLNTEQTKTYIKVFITAMSMHIKQEYK